MKFITYNFYFMTIIMGMSMKNMFMVWFFIELSMILFIPIHSKQNISNYNNMMKYFIVQSISSSIMVTTMITQFAFKINSSMSSTTLNIALWMKMGLFPFSSWYFQVTENMEWKMWFLINSFQKLVPLWILANMPNILLINLALMINAMYSSLEIFNQTSLRWLLNSSSINHISWVLVSFNSKSNIWEIYMMVYIIISFSTYIILMKLNLNTSLSFFSMDNLMKLNISLNIMNFMGLPPMLGFLPKYMIIKSLNLMILLMPLIINNMLLLMVYIKMMYNLMNKNTINKHIINNNNNTLLSINVLMYFMLSFIIIQI